jgi:hypothetical protein
VFSHAVSDTLYLIPFLFITYVAMEWLEHKSSALTQATVARAGAAGPIVGAILGAIPQCGLSAMAATLYAGRVITLGTLYAVFLSTSDEMLPIFLAEAVPLNQILSILGAKIVVGMVMGLATDAVLRVVRRDRQNLRIHELCEQDKCQCSQDCATCEHHPETRYAHVDDCAAGCAHTHHAHDHDHDAKNPWPGILKSSAKHTVVVIVFVFLITVVLNALLEFVGEDALADFLSSNSNFSVLMSALVGLIPNCAASILIAQLYVKGVLGAGAMISGLLVSAGVGLLVLARANRPGRQTVGIVVALYVMGVFWGFVVQALGLHF